MEELAEHIRPDFPDVKIKTELRPDGTVSSGIEWNFRNDSAIKLFKHRYNLVEIIVFPLTEDLAVRGHEEFEVLSKSQWSSDPKLLEDAIARVYHKPMSMFGPLLRM